MEPAETLIQELLLGRYLLLERLGAGGFGVVWRAHDELLDREVALKRIALPFEEDRERATREALATARLAHPAIVALYEACADEDAFYLISELVEGDTLERLIAQDVLGDEEILEIGSALADALRHAHGRGVIHRDVKPSNVLVPDEDGSDASGAVAKLADFGGARLAGEDALTRAGDVLGTLAYMAPEQSEGREVGIEADLYSLGLVLYEALSGVNPVRGNTPAATARRIGEPIVALERRRRDLPRDLTRAIDRALHHDPARRGTLAELQQALDPALERGLERRPAHGSAWEPAKEDLRARPSPRATHNAGIREHAAERADDAPRASAIVVPRLVWIGCVLALAIWQAASGRPGVSLFALAAGMPLLALPRRGGPGWLVAALAPVLGLAGLAGAFPAIAGQRASLRARAAIAALGFWWLALAEPLLGRRLWEGPPAGLPPHAAWEGSLGGAAMKALGATLTLDLLIGAAVWMVASAILPWIVRGRRAALDVLAAVAWTVALLAAPALLESALSLKIEASPRGALLGAALGCVLAVCARALRGP